MRVLVAGATSVLGRHILVELRARGHVVRVLGRDEKKLATLGADEVFVGDALVASSLGGALDGVDVVISSVGASVLPSPFRGLRGFETIDFPANRHLADAAKASGAKKFVYVSVATGPSLPHLAYCRAHERVVEHLRAIGLPYSVLRPTAFFSALSEFVKFASLGIVPVMGAPFRTNPIHDADLAAACVEAMHGPSSEIELGGPEIVTRREIAELAAKAAKKSPLFLELSPRWFSLGSVLSFMFPRISQLLSFFAHVMSRDMVVQPYGSRTLSAYFSEWKS